MEDGSRSHRLKVLVVCTGVFMASLDLFIVNVAFPDIHASFRQAGLGDLSWILNAYAIAFGALLVPAGRWADRIGRKSVFLLGLGIFTAASAACAVAPSVAVLVAARAVQAVGAAMLFPASLGLLLPEWPAERRAIPVGIWSAVSGVAAAAGPPLGGLLVQADWRWVFIVNVPIGIAAIAAGAAVLTNLRDEDARGRPDLLGAILFTAGVAALVAAIVQGDSWGWGSGRVMALFGAAVVLIAVVAVRCVRHPLPLVEPAIVRTRAVALANIASTLFFMAFAALLLVTVLFQTEVWHLSALTAGLQMAPAPLTSAIVAVPAAILGQRYGHRYVGAAGTLVMALAGLWFRQRATLEPEYLTVMLPSMIVGGAGAGLILPALSAAATGPLPPSRFATGTAILGMTRQVGSALGVALFVAVLGRPTVETVIADYQDVWTLLIAGSLASGAAMLSIGRVRIPAPPLGAYPIKPLEPGSDRP